MVNTIHQYNVLNTPWPLANNSIDCCVTSPPYWGLRDYNNPDQIGLEKTPEEFVAKMVLVFNEVRRVLKPEGTLWLNLGDSYNGYPANITKGKSISAANQDARHFKEKGYGLAAKNLKPKDLVGIPWMVAFALRSAGWYLRQDIIWSKPNPMPESVTDRCTKAHEYIFMFSKNRKYYYDAAAIRDAAAPSSIQRWQQDIENQEGSSRVPGKTNGNMKAVGGPKVDEQMSMGANKRSVWTVSTKPFKGSHFATFPEDLITPCILAGCPKEGVVIDPFMGAGTTALVAMSHGRKYIGFELNPDYIAIANKRLKDKLGMFA